MRSLLFMFVIALLVTACESDRGDGQTSSPENSDDMQSNTDGSGVPGFGNDDGSSNVGDDSSGTGNDSTAPDTEAGPDMFVDPDTSGSENDIGNAGGDDIVVCTPNCTGKECGDDGCGATCGTCDANTECQPDGQCAAVVSESCKDLASCIGPCGGNAACGQACVANSTPTVQQQVQSINDCVSQNCQDCGPTDAVCIQKCTFENCSDQYFGCFSGTSTCMGVLQCMQGCAGNQGCAAACVAVGTKIAQLAYYEIVYCVFDECGPNPSAQCQQTATSGACQGQLNECASN